MNKRRSAKHAIYQYRRFSWSDFLDRLSVLLFADAISSPGKWLNQKTNSLRDVRGSPLKSHLVV